MRFISALVAGALAAVAVAQTTGDGPNPFTNSDYAGIATGSPVTITWTPTTEGTVTIELVQGDPKDLTPVTVIQSGIENSGSFEWTPDASIVESTDYALKIVDDNDPSNFNYTPLFTIASDIKTSSIVPSSTTEAPTSTEEPTTTTDATTGTTDTMTTSTDASTTGESSTMATSTTSRATTTTSQPSSSSSAAAATAKVGAGLVGFVGAAMLLL